MRVRPMSLDDERAVLALMCKLWPDCDDETVTDDATFVVERDDGTLGGFITLTPRPYVEGCADQPVPCVEGWWVDEDLRGQAWGRALVDAAEQWARSLGACELASDARVDNAGSIGAHTRLGFDEVERAATFRKPLAAGKRAFVRRARPDLPTLIAAANLVAHALGTAAAGGKRRRDLGARQGVVARTRSGTSRSPVNSNCTVNAVPPSAST